MRKLKRNAMFGMIAAATVMSLTGCSIEDKQLFKNIINNKFKTEENKNQDIYGPAPADESEDMVSVLVNEFSGVTSERLLDLLDKIDMDGLTEEEKERLIQKLLEQEEGIGELIESKPDTLMPVMLYGPPQMFTQGGDESKSIQTEIMAQTETIRETELASEKQPHSEDTGNNRAEETTEISTEEGSTEKQTEAQSE